MFHSEYLANGKKITWPANGYKARARFTPGAAAGGGACAGAAAAKINIKITHSNRIRAKGDKRVDEKNERGVGESVICVIG